MTLRHLEIFSAVCAQESFTRAAEELLSNIVLTYFIAVLLSQCGREL